MLEGKDPIQSEKNTLEKMVRLYCKAKHKKKIPCQGCQELIDYARERLEACPHGEGKPTCEKCPIHCYKPRMREQVREVMRYAGPRMIIFHPVDAVRHLIKGKKRITK